MFCRDDHQFNDLLDLIYVGGVLFSDLMLQNETNYNFGFKNLPKVLTP